MHAVIGVLMDDTDPLVTVMKVEKAPQETYADIGGLDSQIQEIKVRDVSNTEVDLLPVFTFHIFLCVFFYFYFFIISYIEKCW